MRLAAYSSLRPAYRNHPGRLIRDRPGELLMGLSVAFVVGSGFRFADRGSHVLKEISGRWRLYAAEVQSA